MHNVYHVKSVLPDLQNGRKIATEFGDVAIFDNAVNICGNKDTAINAIRPKGIGNNAIFNIYRTGTFSANTSTRQRPNPLHPPVTIIFFPFNFIKTK